MIPSSVLLFTGIYGILGLEYESTGEIKSKNLFKNPFILTHQMFPKLLWFEGDILALFVLIASFFINLSFVLNPKIKNKHKMFYNGHNLISNSKGNIMAQYFEDFTKT